MIWKYEWYYFGDIVSMVQTQTPGEYRGYLVWEMLALGNSNPRGLLDILNDKNDAQNESKLFEFVRNLGLISNRKMYDWSTRSSHLKVELCYMPVPEVRNHCFLTPETLYIPWPFPVITGNLLRQHVGSAFMPNALQPGDFNQNRHLLIDPCLNCIDRLLMDTTANGQKYRDQLLNAASEADKHQAVKDYSLTALGQSLLLPDPNYFKFNLIQDMPTNETSLESDGAVITMNCGFKKAATALYEIWPHGGFDGNNS